MPRDPPGLARHVAYPVRLQVAASRVVSEGARFAEPSVFSVRYAEVDLRDVLSRTMSPWHLARACPRQA